MLAQPKTKNAEVDEVAEDISDVTNRKRHFPPEEVIFGTSRVMEDVRKRLERVARIDVPILIRGEVGTGKETLARLIHRRYPGEISPFYKVTPGDRNGWRKSASFMLQGEDGNAEVRCLHTTLENRPCVGTLFFEDIAEFNPASQQRLLRLLCDDQPTGMDAAAYSRCLFRVICSTPPDIEKQVRMGSFQEDLFYSISIVSLYIPPLRERREDIPAIVHYLWERCRIEFISDVQPPSARLIEVFQRYAWPGNTRELGNMVKRYVLFDSEEKIIRELTVKRHYQPVQKLSPRAGISLKSLAKQEIQELERNIILKTLHATKWNRKQAARALKISYRTLLYKIKEAGVPPKRTTSKREKEP